MFTVVMVPSGVKTEQGDCLFVQKIKINTLADSGTDATRNRNIM